MTPGAGTPIDDITVRDVLSSLTALQALSMAMTDTRGEDEILDLAVSALPSLSRHCRAEAVWLDGAWQSIDTLRERAGPPVGLEDQIADLGSAGGALLWPGIGWGRAFPLSSRGGASGYLVVGSPEPPPEHEWSIILALAQQTGMALAQARLLGRERATRARIVDEQATLRRLGTLVAQAATPETVFAAVAAEAGRLLEADTALLSRYDADGSATVVGQWTKAGGVGPLPPGTRLEPGGLTTHSLVFQTGRPARIEDYGDEGVGATLARAWDIRSVVGVPIHLDGQLWGFIGMATKSEELLPPETEEWLAGFTDLLATAVASTQVRTELRRFAEEQAALRRVATLVAQAAPPEEVFAAVSAEVGRLLQADFTFLGRHEPDGAVTVLGAWARADPTLLPVGIRLEPSGHNVHTLVFRSGRPARIDDYGDAADVTRDWVVRSAVGAPVSVEGRLWGVISVALTGEQALPAGAEERLAGFTELIGTAVANAEAQAALTTSRARIVAAADTARRRIERDLHDGAQQHLVSLALQLRAMRAAVPPDDGDLAAQMDSVVTGLGNALEELRELARGIHPATLVRGGLGQALRTLARRSAVPVRLDLSVEGRLPEAIELAAYYVVAEALTNAAKHAEATGIDVQVAVRPGVLWACVRDNGRGGAHTTHGSGLVGLTDRVEALGGRIWLYSPPGAGTSVEVTLPLGDQ